MADWNLFVSQIQQSEGGYQNEKSDWGNKNSLKVFVGTNYGISAIFYEGIIGRPPTVADMKSITKADALIFFKRYFWDKIKASDINSQAVADTFADHSINSNPKGATRIMQVVLNKLGNNLTEDGYVGNNTLKAINNADSKELFLEYNKAREVHYRKLSNFNKWGNIWLNRIKKVHNLHITGLKYSVKFVKKKYKTIIIVVFILVIVGFLIYKTKK